MKWFKNRISIILIMTIFSLGNACDLDHFSGNTKITNEGFDVQYSAPVVPLPTDPPNPPFGKTNYQWPSMNQATNEMTSYNSGQSFHPMTGSDSQGWGTASMGQDYWGEESDKWTSDNKLLNYNLTNNQVAGNNVIMPNMRPQATQMPTSRTQFMHHEDMNGRLKNPPVKKPPVAVVVEEEALPAFPIDKIQADQKNTWTYLIILFIILIGTIMYRSKYF